MWFADLLLLWMARCKALTQEKVPPDSGFKPRADSTSCCGCCF